MKIGIVTLVGDNYGNKYQNFAVEQLLSRYGTVETFSTVSGQPVTSANSVSLSRRLSPSHIFEALRCRLMGKYGINNVARPIVLNGFYALFHKAEIAKIRKERNEAFASFQKKRLHVSEKILDAANVRDMQWVEQFDCFFCGSDQIWNPTYATTSELMFLSFAKDRSVSIAPSFGLQTLTEEAKKKYSEWLQYVKVLSVREESGQKLIHELTHRNAELLLDPTMALERDQWDALASKPTCSLPKKYLLCYFLGRIDRTCQRRVRELAAKKGLEIVRLFDVESPEYYALDPAEVLFCIRNAEYVATDSFHGTVFSILYHKSFTVFERNEGSLNMFSRIDTLLRFFGLTARTNENEAVSEESWEGVDRLLEQERAHTERFIDEAIKAIKNEAAK